MAQNTQQLLKVNLAIIFTGNASPGCQENKPADLIFIGLATSKNF